MTSTATTAPAAPIISTWFKGRDDYGRTVRSFYSNDHGQAWGCKAVVVTLPKVARKPGEMYLVNVWADPAENVTRHATLRAAQDFAAAEVRRLAQ